MKLSNTLENVGKIIKKVIEHFENMIDKNWYLQKFDLIQANLILKISFFNIKSIE